MLAMSAVIADQTEEATSTNAQLADCATEDQLPAFDACNILCVHATSRTSFFELNVVRFSETTLCRNVIKDKATLFQ